MIAQVVDVLGLDDVEVRTPKDLALLAKQGIPRSAVEHVAQSFGVSLKDFSEYLNVTIRSIQSYKKGELLSSIISDHIIQLADLYVQGVNAMDKEPFKQWLQMYNPALGIRPADLLQTSTGIEAVKDELIRIDYSVFA